MDRRKYTVLKITVVNHGQNQSTGGQPRVLSIVDDAKEGNTQLSKSASQNTSQDIMRGTDMPLTFKININGSNIDDIPLNDLLSDKPLPINKHLVSTSNEQVLSPNKETTESSSEKPGKVQGQSDPKVLLEAKLNPLRIGIRVDDDKNKVSETTSKQGDKVSLEDVLQDIDDTTKTANATRDEDDSSKENTVVISLNNDSKKANHSNIQQKHFDKNEEKLGSVHIQATSQKKENNNGTEVNTAGVSITTESKGLQTDVLMKVLLSKLLGSDISEALKVKVAQELKSTNNPKAPNDYPGKQRPLSLDMASTTPMGTSVESPPGTIKGVDTAEMNNNAGAADTAQPPQMVATSPQCFGGGSRPGVLNSAGSRVPDNTRLPGGSDCPTTQVASSFPTGMVIESAPGTQQAVGTGIPSPSQMAPNPPPSLPPTGGFASTAPVGVSVESPPGTIQAVGTSIPEEGVSKMEGDNGKIKW